MTEQTGLDRSARRARLSKRALRAWAWIAGATALFVPIGALAAQPRVTSTTVAGSRPVIVKKILRRVIVVAPKAKAVPPRIVYVGGGSTGGGGAAPVTTTGGSGVPR